MRVIEYYTHLKTTSRISNFDRDVVIDKNEVGEIDHIADTFWIKDSSGQLRIYKIDTLRNQSWLGNYVLNSSESAKLVDYRKLLR